MEANPPRTERRPASLLLEALGIALLVVAAMATLALLSFNPADVDPLGEAAATGRTENLIGPVGAFFADLLLGLAGAGAIILVVALTLTGILLLTGRRLQAGLKEVAGFAIFLLTSTALLHLLMPGAQILGKPPGGTTGEIVGEVLRSLFSQTGAIILALGMLLIAIILVSDLSIVSGLCSLGTTLRNWSRRIFHRRPAGSQQAEDADQEPHPDWEGDTRAGAGATPQRKERSGLAGIIGRRRQRASIDADAGSGGGTVTRGEGGDDIPDYPINGVSEDDHQAEDDWAYGDGAEDDLTGEDGQRRFPFIGKVGGGKKKKDKAGRKGRGTKGAPDGTDQEGLDTDNTSSGEATAAPAKDRSAPPKESEAECAPAFSLPGVDILDKPPSSRVKIPESELKETARKLEEKLGDYGVTGSVVAINPGPVVTMFEFAPGPGIKISRIAGLSDDLAMALAAVRVRIVAPIPGKAVVGIEVPNTKREMVYLQEMLADDAFRSNKARLPLALGKDISGRPIIEDLAKMPHLLVAGSTGSGKSVAVNGMLLSLLYRHEPENLRLILVDPKMLEFNVYEGIPHLLLPVVTDPKKAAIALKWAVDEMERRYSRMAEVGVRSVIDYNRWAEKKRQEAVAKGRERLVTVEHDYSGFGPGDGDDRDGEGMEEWEENLAISGKEVDPLAHFPYIVVIIDEFCDLMMVAPKDVEQAVMRLAQKARAAGIHVVLATQRPSVDVITGTIKANFPSRMAFRVAQREDSRTVLGTVGAEALLGNGDMLFLRTGSNLERIHGPFVSDDEVKGVVKYLQKQGAPEYDLDILNVPDEEPKDGGNGEGEEYDELWDDALAIVAEKRIASASMLQRKLSIGFNRAARIIERMEREGVVGPGDGAKPREVLIPPLG